MQQWNLDEESSEVHPGRDAERSMHTFDDAKRKIVGKAMAPIGVFDSGAGGLTILSALQQELPQEDYIYIGDTEHCPYGVRSDAEIAELTTNACRFLVQQGVKLIVIACNTASQAALNVVRSVFDVPFVGVVPAVKPAARATTAWAYRCCRHKSSSESGVLASLDRRLCRRCAGLCGWLSRTGDSG